jgi:DNA uptake protein ComE-like DNA-binding protein
MTSKSNKINLNNTTIEELMTIPGIGKTLSMRIYINAPYNSIYEVYNLYHIGPTRFANIKKYCYVPII